MTDAMTPSEWAEVFQAGKNGPSMLSGEHPISALVKVFSAMEEKAREIAIRHQRWSEPIKETTIMGHPVSEITPEEAARMRPVLVGWTGPEAEYCLSVIDSIILRGESISVTRARAQEASRDAYRAKFGEEQL